MVPSRVSTEPNAPELRISNAWTSISMDDAPMVWPSYTDCSEAPVGVVVLSGEVTVTGPEVPRPSVTV